MASEQLEREIKYDVGVSFVLPPWTVWSVTAAWVGAVRGSVGQCVLRQRIP